MNMRAGRKRKTGERYPNGDLVNQPKPQDHFWHAWWETLIYDAMGLYVIEAGPAIKIGISTRPPARARELQVAQHNQVRLIETFWMRHVDALAAERALHYALRQAGFGAQGEWFYLSPEAAVEFVQRELARLGLWFQPQSKTEQQRKAA
jgi:hypothetical protein